MGITNVADVMAAFSGETGNGQNLIPTVTATTLKAVLPVFRSMRQLRPIGYKPMNGAVWLIER